jgi:hypothetical protein
MIPPFGVEMSISAYIVAEDEKRARKIFDTGDLDRFTINEEYFVEEAPGMEENRVGTLFSLLTGEAKPKWQAVLRNSDGGYAVELPAGFIERMLQITEDEIKVIAQKWFDTEPMFIRNLTDKGSWENGLRQFVAVIRRAKERKTPIFLFVLP